jgi:uncharacterized protein YbaR (Trm112 family)
MPAESKQPFPIDKNMLEQLACPACLGGLRLDRIESVARLVCVECGCGYPIVDGIPVLITERAVDSRS